jgi:hypothetical protein
MQRGLCNNIELSLAILCYFYMLDLYCNVPGIAEESDEKSVSQLASWSGFETDVPCPGI